MERFLHDPDSQLYHWWRPNLIPNCLCSNAGNVYRYITHVCSYLYIYLSSIFDSTVSKLQTKYFMSRSACLHISLQWNLICDAEFRQLTLCPPHSTPAYTAVACVGEHVACVLARSGRTDCDRHAGGPRGSTWHTRVLWPLCRISHPRVM